MHHLSEPAPRPAALTEVEWMARIDTKLGHLINILGAGRDPAGAEEPNHDSVPAPAFEAAGTEPVELVEPAPSRRVRTRQGQPVQ